MQHPGRRPERRSSSEPPPSVRGTRTRYWQTRLAGGPLLQFRLQQSESLRHDWPAVEHVGQSCGQSTLVSPGSQVPLPQNAQSTSQVVPFSAPSHVPSPQQYGTGAPQVTPPELQRLSVQSTGFSPPPSPQQKRFDGLPF